MLLKLLLLFTLVPLAEFYLLWKISEVSSLGYTFAPYQKRQTDECATEKSADRVRRYELGERVFSNKGGYDDRRDTSDEARQDDNRPGLKGNLSEYSTCHVFLLSVLTSCIICGPGWRGPGSD